MQKKVLFYLPTHENSLHIHVNRTSPRKEHDIAACRAVVDVVSSKNQNPREGIETKSIEHADVLVLTASKNQNPREGIETHRCSLDKIGNDEQN